MQANNLIAATCHTPEEALELKYEARSFLDSLETTTLGRIVRLVTSWFPRGVEELRGHSKRQERERTSGAEADSISAHPQHS